MSNDVDIYSDLPEDTKSNYIVELESKLETLQKKYEKLNQDFIACERLKNKFGKNYDVLKKHSSSLLFTAKREIKRKDKSMNELRAEYDNLVFRRREETLKNKRGDQYTSDNSRKYYSTRCRSRIEKATNNSSSEHREVTLNHNHSTPMKVIYGDNSLFKVPKLMSPIAATPDHVKQKLRESNTKAVGPIVPMLNEHRVLENSEVNISVTTPFKNCCVMEVKSTCDNSLEKSNISENNNVKIVSGDMEQGNFSKRGRKRPLLLVSPEIPVKKNCASFLMI